MLQKIGSKEVPLEIKNSLYKLYTSGKFELVIEKLKSLIIEFPHSTFLFNLSGSTNLALKNIELAIKNFETACKINPNLSESY